MKLRFSRRWLAVLALLPIGACARLGELGNGAGTVLALDARHLAPGDLAGPGPHRVDAVGLDGWDGEVDFPFVVYRPTDVDSPSPAVVFLPGLMAPESQYESYARDLASRGFVVAVRGWYGPFKHDATLAKDATELADWMVRRGLADPARLGVAGHSRGAKDALLAAARDPRFHAVVALEPDDQGEKQVIGHELSHVAAAILLVGAEVGWQGWSVCAPKATNYERFFAGAPAGTTLVELRDADHVQVMDDPDALGMGICRRGHADSQVVRTLARRATVDFFQRRLAGLAGPPLVVGDAGRVRVKGAGASAPVAARVVTPATR